MLDTPQTDLSSEQKILPGYIGISEEHHELQDQIASDLFFKQQHRKLEGVFRSMCRYAVKTKSPVLPFKNLFDYVLKQDNPGINVERTLNHALTECSKILNENNYANIQFKTDQKDELRSITLTDPFKNKIKSWLNDFYNGDNQLFYNTHNYPSPLPCLAFVSAKFKLKGKKVNYYIHSIENSKLRDKAFSKMDETHDIIRVHFEELDQIRPRFTGFESKTLERSSQKTALPVINDLIILSSFSPTMLASHFMIPLIMDVIEANNHLKEDIESYLKKEKFIKDTDVFKILTNYTTLSSDKLYHTVSYIKSYFLSDNFINNYANLMGNNYASAKVFPAYLIQALLFLITVISNKIEDERNERNMESDKNKNYANIVHQLTENIREQTIGDEGFAGYVYYPADLEMIGNLKSVTGEATLEKIYGNEGLKKLILKRKKDDKDLIPIICYIETNGYLYFFSRWRIIDIFFSEVQKEAARVESKLLERWLKSNSKTIPKENEIVISQDMLSPFFNKFLKYCFDVNNLYPTIKELKKIVLPDPISVTFYKLTKSNLVAKEHDTLSSRALNNKVIDFKEALFESLTSPKYKPLKDILEISYPELMKKFKNELKKKERAKKQSEEGGFLYNVINTLYLFIVSLFSSETSNQLRKEQYKKKTRTKKDFPRKPLEKFAGKFHIPPSKEELRKELDRHLDTWNKIFIDPKNYFPNWNTLSFAEREKKKLIVKNETEKRKQSSKEQVDRAVKKVYSNFDLEGISDEALTNNARYLAERFRKHDLKPLISYIKKYIIYINTQ